MSDININDFNKFLQLASESLICGPECQRDKTSEELRQMVIDAKTNVITAPYKVETSIKNYITYTKGESAYNEYNEQQLNKQAKNLSDQMNTSFQEGIQNTSVLNDTYSGLLSNYDNIVELYNNYLIENQNLEEDIKEKNSDVLTNNRKTYYQDQGIDSLNSYYKLFMIFYIIIWVLFIVFIFVFKSTYSRIQLIGIAFLLIIYPLFATYIFIFFYNIYSSITSVLPKNVYKTI